MFNKIKCEFFDHVSRGQSRGVARWQILEHPGTRKGAGRIGDTLQLQKNSNDNSGYRLPAMGHRPTMLPNHYDEDWPLEAGRVHGFLKEVIFSLMSTLTFQLL